MSSFIFFSVPAHGHVNPTLPVVTELIQRGHRVTYYNSEDMRAKIAATGVEFRAYPEAMPSHTEFAQLVADGNMAHVSLEMLRFTARIMPYLLDMLQREKPDVVVFDSLALWGQMAAQRLNIPSVANITHFVFDGSQETRPGLRDIAHLLGQVVPMVPAFVRIRKQLSRDYGDVFPRGDIFPARGTRSIVYTSAALQPKTKMLNDTFRYVGASINPTTRNGDFPFEQLQHKPVVYISLGTINNLATDFYRQAFAAFADHAGQFILSAGQHTDIASLGKIPANFIVRQSVPQLAILQHSNLFISHGGMNSVHESLYYDVPLIVVPQQMEQLINGKVVAAKGAGVLLGDKPPYGRVTAAQLRAAADEVLNTPRYRQNAQRLGASLREAGGYQRAADELEQMAHTQSVKSY